MKAIIENLIKTALKSLDINEEQIIVEIPKNKDNGDYSSNIAMKLAKVLKDNPINIAGKIKDLIHDDNIINIEVVAPGFINFFVKKDYLFVNINYVIEQNENYGKNNIGNGEKVNIEFVSANPTGILHMGNARGGAYGDSLARIMKLSGFDVTKEYYMNDAGNQINKLGRSILSRYLDLKGIDNEFPEDGYPSSEIIDIAKEIYESNKDLTSDDLEYFKDKGVEYLSTEIFKDLKEYRIDYDVITSERSIYKKYPIKEIINTMDENGYLYEKDGATWFKSSLLYDDSDHVFIKADGNYTYVVPDIPYHIDKINRGFNTIIDVLGTDHHGYVARLKSGVKAAGYDADRIDVKLLQLVRVVKNGEAVAMHKRSGNVITLKDLIDEVGVNAVRYYFSRYSLDTQMDFDIELAKSKSNENPVFYVCYAYARINSILNKYPNIEKVSEFENIKDEAAYNVLMSMYNFPEVVKNSACKRMPHLITNYVYELASLFHTYYEKCQIITDNEQETLENLNMIKAIKITIFNALNLIGVIPEERM